MRRTSDDDVRDENWQELLWEKERHIMELEAELEGCYRTIAALEKLLREEESYGDDI